MNLLDERQHYIDEGLSIQRASVKVCLDIFLSKLERSIYKDNVVLKGGAVMQNISGYLRRSTKDIDFDFIHYSIDDDSITRFIDGLNNEDDDVTICVIGKIKESKQHDYKGKNVSIRVTDVYNNRLETNLDIGVQSDLTIIQNHLTFNISNNREVVLLANSNEQIFTEKLRSLLIHGVGDTRYKDIFDFYYLITEQDIDSKTLLDDINKIILVDEKIINLDIKDMNSLVKTINIIFNNDGYINRLEESKDRWLDIPIKDIISTIINYLEKIRN